MVNTHTHKLHRLVVPSCITLIWVKIWMWLENWGNLCWQKCVITNVNCQTGFVVISGLIEAQWRKCASVNLVTIGSGDGLLPVWDRAITSNNTGLILPICFGLILSNHFHHPILFSWDWYKLPCTDLWLIISITEDQHLMEHHLGFVHHQRLPKLQVGFEHGSEARIRDSIHISMGWCKKDVTPLLTQWPELRLSCTTPSIYKEIWCIHTLNSTAV